MKKANKKYTGYILFCIEQRPILKEEFPDLNSREITKELGKKWKSLPVETKLSYKDSKIKKDYKEENDDEDDDYISPLLCLFFYIYYTLCVTVVYTFFHKEKVYPIHSPTLMLPNPYDNIYPIPLPLPSVSYLPPDTTDTINQTFFATLLGILAALF
jgi:hypothetical protein